MTSFSKDSHNEVILRRGLRLYRNAVVSFIRERFNNTFSDDSLKELGSLYRKVDETTGLSRWEVMKRNALLARASPEISTELDDDFEVLGVADFYGVFEKFFEVLLPQTADPAGVADAFKAGLLRCMRQIKVARDPAAHEVSQDIGQDELILTFSNCILVLKAIGCQSDALALRGLVREVITEKPNYAVCMVCSENSLVQKEIARRLRSEGVTYTLREAAPNDAPSEYDMPDWSSSAENAIVLVEGEINPESSLAGLVKTLARSGRNILPVVMHNVSDSDWRATAGQLGVRYSPRVPFHPEYASECITRIVSALQPPLTTPTPLRAPPEVAVAEAISDGELIGQLAVELSRPDLKQVWLMSPFASDVDEWKLRGQPLSDVLAKHQSRGVVINLITRPPNESEDVELKRRFLDSLELNGVSVLTNSALHAKVYLFDSGPVRRRWFVGSHNLTKSGLGSLREVSMSGYRVAEYDEAKTALLKITNSPATVAYSFWKARQARIPRKAQK